MIDRLSAVEDEPVVVDPTWIELCLEASGLPFELRNGLGQCSWVLQDSMVTLPNSFVRYVASERKSAGTKLHWVAPQSDFSNAVLVQREDETTETYLHLMKRDSSYVWIDAATGCLFPGPCPQRPLKWSNIPINEDFDFEGQESLLATDVFLGAGEAPVHPIMAGTVLMTGRDSLGNFILLDHGDNVVSKMQGMFVPVAADSVRLSRGDSVTLSTVVGRLAPRDSSQLYLSIRRNGLFVRWNDFYGSAHPVDSLVIAKFRSKMGL